MTYPRIAAVFTLITLSVVRVSPADESPRKPPRDPEPRPLSLREMCKDAELIFVGKVNRIEDGLYTPPDSDTPPVPTRLISFSSSWILKDCPTCIRLDGVFAIRCAAEFKSFVEPGDEVLWFLPKPDRFGFASPLGRTSGDFRIKVYRIDPTKKFAMNRNGNVGLGGPATDHVAVPLDDLVRAIEGELREGVNR